ncbi:hypothetical protein GCM10009087_23770 [Sphingomonas oligophenolica]|uniref:Uncharacterized protein n=1 Tax=Sphingomonas oligophenolica TaxID=301154 RepID=A0ABU9Y1F4_9SPHN
MNPSSTDAAEALAAMHASQARLAAAANCPPERHLAFGALLGNLVATPALPTTWTLVAEGFILVGIVLVVRWDRRRTGMFINGYRSGRTRPVTFGMLAVFLILYSASTWLSRGLGIHWAPLALGAVAAAVGYYASVLWARIFKREMELGA